MDYFKELEKQKNVGHCHNCDTNWLTWKDKIESCPFCKSKNVTLDIKTSS